MKRRVLAILVAVTLVGGTCLTTYAEENNSQDTEAAQTTEENNSQDTEAAQTTEENNSQDTEAAQTTEENESQAEETTKIIEEQDAGEEEDELFSQTANQEIAVQKMDSKVSIIGIGNQYYTPGDYTWNSTTKEIYPGVTYDIENNVLTFNNADVSVPKVLTDSGTHVYPPFDITAEGEESDLTVVIKGTNRIGYSETIEDNLTIDNIMHFSHFRKVTFTGDGTLTLASQGNTIDGISMGFCPYEARDTDGTKFEMQDCTLKIDATKTSVMSFKGIRLSDDFIMKSGTLIIDGGDGNETNSFFGIGNQFSYGKRIDLLGGTININGPKGYSSAIDFGHGVLNIENMTINIDDQLCKYGHAFYGKADPEGICKESGKIYVKNSNIQYKSKVQSGYADSVVCAELEETGKLYNYVGDESADQKVNSLVEPNQFVEGKSCRYANFIISTKPLQGESEVTLGDINADGQVNLTDVVLCLNHSSKKSLLTGDALAAADVNQDGAVNLTDVMRLMNYVAKKSTTL